MKCLDFAENRISICRAIFVPDSYPDKLHGYLKLINNVILKGELYI